MFPLVIFFAVLAIVLIAAAVRPNQFEVRRSIRVDASTEKVFDLVNQLPAWDQWSPWARKDPHMKKSFSGPSDGVGASYSWDGNRAVGSGRMEIIRSEPPRELALRLDFIKPFRAQNTSAFVLVPEDGATSVTWILEGPMPFPSKVFSLFVSMDKMIGKDFEAGLANLKAAAETSGLNPTIARP